MQGMFMDEHLCPKAQDTNQVGMGFNFMTQIRFSFEFLFLTHIPQPSVPCNVKNPCAIVLPLVQSLRLPSKAVLRASSLWPGRQRGLPEPPAPAPTLQRASLCALRIRHQGDEGSSEQHQCTGHHHGESQGGMQFPSQGHWCFLRRLCHYLW